MNKILRTILGIWILFVVLTIAFKIKIFVEIFPIVGVIFAVFLLVYTIQQIIASYFPKKTKKNIDKKTK